MKHNLFQNQKNSINQIKEFYCQNNIEKNNNENEEKQPCIFLKFIYSLKKIITFLFLMEIR